MVKTKYLLLGVVIGIIGIFAVVLFFPSEEKKVKRQFSLLSQWVSKSPNENTFTLLQKMKNMGTLFYEYCELKAPNQSLSGSYTRGEISTYAGSGRSHFSQLDLKFYDLHITFLEKEVVNVTLTGRLTGQSTAGERVDEIQELKCVLRKTENKWLLSEIEVVEVLKK